MLSPQTLHSLLEAEPFHTQDQLDELCGELTDPRNSPIRQAAALALGRAGDRRAVKPLIAALQDPVETVRVAAVTSLGRIGAAEAIAPLLAFLDQESVVQRRCAVEALGEIGDPQAVDPLLAALDGQLPSSPSRRPQGAGPHWRSASNGRTCRRPRRQRRVHTSDRSLGTERALQDRVCTPSIWLGRTPSVLVLTLAEHFLQGAPGEWYNAYRDQRSDRL